MPIICNPSGHYRTYGTRLRCSCVSVLCIHFDCEIPIARIVRLCGALEFRHSSPLPPLPDRAAAGIFKKNVVLGTGSRDEAAGKQERKGKREREIKKGAAEERHKEKRWRGQQFDGGVLTAVCPTSDVTQSWMVMGEPSVLTVVLPYICSVPNKFKAVSKRLVGSTKSFTTNERKDAG
jgi:hypothetical protein